MACREGDELITSVSKERIVADQEGACLPLHDGCEGRSLSRSVLAFTI